MIRHPPRSTLFPSPPLSRSVRSRRALRLVLAPRQPQGRLGGHLRGVCPVVLHADRPRRREGWRGADLAAGGRPARHRLAPPARALLAPGAPPAQPPRLLGALR